MRCVSSAVQSICASSVIVYVGMLIVARTSRADCVLKGETQGPDALATTTKEFSKSTGGVRSWLKDMATGHAKGVECAPLALMEHLRDMTILDHQFTMLLLNVSDLSVALDRAVTALFTGMANTYFRKGSVQTKWSEAQFADELDNVDGVIARISKDCSSSTRFLHYSVSIHDLTCVEIPCSVPALTKRESL